ncbi:MAG: WYL domain-containing protein [Candidatus Riflebacteria bacterium]|nr:WYL domain-containing protein [Candidatus Riflebacteria bacterium]
MKTMALRRFSLILEKVVGDRYPSFAVIKSFLERHGFEVSARTLQRDLSRMEHLFQVKISFDHQKHGYFFDQAQTINLDVFLRFLQVASLGEFLAGSVPDVSQVMRHLSFGTAVEPAGARWLRPLLEAIGLHRLVSFSYRDCAVDQPRNITRLMPLLLREYLGGWYLIGTFSPQEKLQVFGLDGISDLAVEAESFSPDPGTDPAALFARSIGVGQPEGEPQRVRLAFRRVQGEAVKALPWHPSQKVVQEEGNLCVIDLEVIPTTELRQRILMFGASVRVLEPATLASDIAASLREAAGQYPDRTDPPAR